MPQAESRNVSVFRAFSYKVLRFGKEKTRSSISVFHLLTRRPALAVDSALIPASVTAAGSTLNVFGSRRLKRSHLRPLRNSISRAYLPAPARIAALLPDNLRAALSLSGLNKRDPSLCKMRKSFTIASSRDGESVLFYYPLNLPEVLFGV